MGYLALKPHINVLSFQLINVKQVGLAIYFCPTATNILLVPMTRIPMLVQ